MHVYGTCILLALTTTCTILIQVILLQLKYFLLGMTLIQVVTNLDFHSPHVPAVLSRIHQNIQTL